MPNEAVLREIEIGELTIAVDDSRDAADPFKLLAGHRALVVARLAALQAAEAATTMGEAGRAGASRTLRDALDLLESLHRDGYNFIRGILSFQISAAERLEVFTAYGWESGEIGLFTAARIESMANQATAATPLITNAAHRYPTALLEAITAQLAIVNAHQPLATGGSAQAATAARNAALVELNSINERTRHFYCSCSDLREKTPELARIGFQPRRDPGDAAPPAEPGTPGTATYNATAQTLSIAALPEHTTELRAYRQPAGGTPEEAGTSPTTSVTVVEPSPLTPGVTYEFWLVGVNAHGEGPESNHVTHTAT